MTLDPVENKKRDVFNIFFFVLNCDFSILDKKIIETTLVFCTNGDAG